MLNIVWNIATKKLIEDEVKQPKVFDALREFDDLTSGEHRSEAIGYLRNMYHEPLKASDDEVVERHRKRLMHRIN